MADAKVSALGAITVAAITDEMYVVDDATGTPISKKITVGDLLSQNFGQVYTSGGSGTQVPNTSYALMTQWDSDGVSSADITPAAASNKITVTNSGHYFVAFQVSFAGTTSSVVSAAVFWNGVEQSQVTVQRKLGTGSDVGSGSAFGIVDVTSGATDIDLRVKCDGATDDFDLKEGQLLVVRLGNT
jgi:hypothetical protein